MTARSNPRQRACECGRPSHYANGYCNPCWKRLVWRPRNNEALARDRAQSADAKRRRRAAGEKI